MNPKTTRTFLRTIRKNRRHTLRRHILCAGIASLLLLPGHAAGVLLHDYQFSGTFADSLGGPALVPLGGTGTFSATNYSFAARQGLSLSSGLPAAGDYSIVADFSFATPSGYRKIVDFKTQTSDTGLYSLGSSLNFFPVVTGPSGAFASNVALNLALTRDGATNQVTGYVNGAQHITFADASSLAVFTGASNEVRLFIDDNATGGREASAGTVDRVRIFNGALTPAQLAALLAAPAPATFWKGTTDGTWTGANWASDAAGTPTAAIPNAASDITFSATGATHQTTTLGADITIHSLTINDPAGVTIHSGAGGPFSLTLSGNAGTGIDVQAGAGFVLIGGRTVGGLFNMADTAMANVTLAGASDTITVNNLRGAFISAPLAGGNGLKKEGTGTLTLAATSTYTGGTTVNAGTLSIDSPVGNGNPYIVLILNYPTLGTLGSGTATVNGANIPNGTGGTLKFVTLASARNGAFVANGGTASGAGGGNVSFRDYTSAGSGTFMANGGSVAGAHGGSVNFHDSSFAGTGSFTAQGGMVAGAESGTINFYDRALAGTGTFVANGATVTGAQGGSITFHDSSRAGVIAVPLGALELSATGDYNGSGTFNINGGTTTGAEGGKLRFYDHSTGGAAAITANGGTGGGGGGSIWFVGAATGTTGPVTVNGNASLDLSLSFGGVAVGSLAGDGYVFLAPSTLTVGSNNQSTTFSGTIRDDGYIPSTGGGLTKVGSGMLTLAGTNTYTGPTTVNGGILRAGSTQAFGINSAVTVNAPGHLDIGGNDITIGSLSGNGIVQTGNFSAILTTGGLNTDTTFSGQILDGPVSQLAFVKVGSGTQVLSGFNFYTGGTTLKEGTLAAGGSRAFGSGDLMMTGGTLRTDGGPRIVQLGRPVQIDPDGPIGLQANPSNFRFTGGNILFTGGTYVATVGGTTPGVTHDQLKTTGTANVSGATLALVQLGNYHLQAGDKVVLVSAAGGVSGGTAGGTPVAASKVTGLAAFSASPLLIPVVNLYTASVVLEAMQGSFGALAATLSLTPNQIAIAGALDSLLAQTGGKTGVIKELDFLDSLPSSLIAANLDLLNPSAMTSASNLAAALANVQSANTQQRLASLRSSDSGGGATADGTGGGANGPKGARGNAVAPANEDRWGLWMTGSGNFVHIGSTTNGAGINLDSGGVTAGVDYRFTDHFAAGISIGYMNTDASLPNGGKLDVDGGSVGAYATYFNRGLHLDASVSGGPNDYATRRTTPGNTSATASPRGTAVNVLFAAGYDWKWKALTLGPTASFQYTNVQLDGFTERGAFAPLSVAARDSESLRTSLGFRVALDKKIGRAVLRPEVRAAWQHEHGDASHSLTASFATLGGAPFTVTGPATGRDSLLLSAGFSVQWNARFATYAYYDAELFRTNYSSNNVSVGFRWQF